MEGRFRTGGTGRPRAPARGASRVAALAKTGPRPLPGKAPVSGIA
jgi:hypothetical protein